MARTCIVILGPTAVGKTALAIDIAKHFQTDIISADSRQCFRELNTGVAKPTAEELAAVKHYFINSHSIHDDVTAALFEQLSLKWIEEIFNKQHVAVMVGGTGLYIRAFCEGLDDIPSVLPEINKVVANLYEQYGLQGLQQKIKEEDPLFYESGEIQNPQRLMRALAVKMSTGNSILSFFSAELKKRPFNIIKIGLELPRQQLYERINHRVGNMMHQGLLDEATALFPSRELNALQTVGYTELFEHMDGKISLDKAVELIKQHTRNYAKRQLTWFKKDESINWFAPEDKERINWTLHDKERIIKFCQQHMSNNESNTAAP